MRGRTIYASAWSKVLQGYSFPVRGSVARTRQYAPGTLVPANLAPLEPVIQASSDQLRGVSDVFPEGRSELFPQLGGQGRGLPHVLDAKVSYPFGRSRRNPGFDRGSYGPVREEPFQQPVLRHATYVVRCIKIRHKRRVNAEKAIYTLHGLQRVPPEVIEKEYVHLATGEHIEVALQLLMVPANLHPPRVAPCPLGCGSQVAVRIEAPA